MSEVGFEINWCYDDIRALLDKNSKEFLPVETRAHTAATMEDQVNQMMAMFAKMDEQMEARNKEMNEKMDARNKEMKEVEFLGHTVLANGIKTTETKIILTKNT